MAKVQVTLGYKIHHSFLIQAAMHLGTRELLRMIKFQVSVLLYIFSLTVCMKYIKIRSFQKFYKRKFLFSFFHFHTKDHREQMRWEGASGDHLIQPPSPLKQGQLEQGAQDQVQLSFQYLQGWRLHKPPYATCSSVQSALRWIFFLLFK